jgi:hypothetical protein
MQALLTCSRVVTSIFLHVGRLRLCFRVYQYASTMQVATRIVLTTW